ncbi:MAG TPA: hypothetical protein VIK48_02330, partial [Candidatus Manganitrophaceae bacterium]
MKKSFIEKLNLEEGTDTAALYGSYDRHIKMIERAFSVKVRARGEEITIEGEPDQVKQAERVIGELTA